MTKRNYRQAKRQKEEARKLRQQQKEQRRSERATAAGVSHTIESAVQQGEPATTMHIVKTLVQQA